MLRRLVPVALAAATLYSPPAHAQTGFAFTGTSFENCFGCTYTRAWFTGSLTGVVNGNAYVGASMAIEYEMFNAPGMPQCLLTSSGNGTMTVTDGSTTDEVEVSVHRNLFHVTIGMPGALGTATYVPDVLGLICDSPAVTFEVHGSVAGT